MTHPIRSLLALSIIAIVLAACGTAVGAPASEPPAPSQPASPAADPSVEPSVRPSVRPSAAPAAPSAPAVPSAPADEERVVDGVITVYPGTWSGPGGSIQEALDNGSDAADLPSLVNGVLFRDTDGRIFLATSVSDVTAPTFDGPMLEVLGYPNEGPMWDMASAELIGIEEANGIVFMQNTQILGTLEVH
jgi:hypothetical protein